MPASASVAASTTAIASPGSGCNVNAPSVAVRNPCCDAICHPCTGSSRMYGDVWSMASIICDHAMATGIGQLARIEGNVGAALDAHVVDVDRHAGAADAFDSRGIEDTPVDLRERDRLAEAPADSLDAATQRMEVIGQHALECLLHLTAAGGIPDDDVGEQLDLAVDGRHHEQLGGDQAMLVEPGGHARERLLARNRFGFVAKRLGYDHDGDDARHAGDGRR